MLLIIAIDITVIAVLSYLAFSKGLEAALPYFVFFVVLIPGESVIFLPGLFTVTTQRVALSTLTLLYLFHRPRPATNQISRTPLKYLMLIHIVWCALSTANSVAFTISLKYLISQVLEYYLMYFILTRTISSSKTIHKMLGAMVAAVFVACIFGVFEAYTGWSVTGLFPYVPSRFSSWGAGEQEARVGRILSTFNHPILFGAAIAFILVDLFYLLGQTKSAFYKVFLWLATLPMFASIYKTGSRGPWLAFMAGMCALFLFPQKGTRRRLAAIACLAVLVLVIRPGVYDSLSATYAGTVTSDPNSQLANSYEYRYALWRVGAHALARDPLRAIWGYGMESWYYLHLVEPFSTNPAYPFDSCDSSWVQAMTETGYVGLVIFGILLLKPALVSIRNFFTMQKPANYLCLVLFINMAQYYFMMYTVGCYSWGQTGYMLWMWIAMAMVYRNLVEGAPAGEDKEERREATKELALLGAT